MSTIIEARDVVKSFGQTPALRGASIAVRPGEIVAVMGRWRWDPRRLRPQPC